MNKQASFLSRAHNPDVLSCIADLSNDEVFTPPVLVNQMLDDLEAAWADSNDGEVIWSDPSVTFLDPCTKSGVFLREIVQRLVASQEDQETDLSERVDRILRTQVFGIGVTSLTALLARRSVYCSKFADGPHSVFSSAPSPEGNIWFGRTEHAWKQGRCSFCGASEKAYSRAEELETYAYEFIHSDSVEDRMREMFGGVVHFDVVIGNPPYQLGSDGGTRDVPIYHHFVEQAKRLNPRFISMVIPARWMASGLGLSEFRETMLSDQCLRTLVDYPKSSDVFPSVEVKGGVCYFIRDANYLGDCSVRTVRNGEESLPVDRDLGEFDVFVRDARSAEILRKVSAHEEPSVTNILSADKEFGWTSNFDGFHAAQSEGDVPVYYVRSGQRKIGFISREEVLKSPELVDRWKVMIPKAGSDGGQKLPDIVLGKPLIAPSPSTCTQTFLFFYLDTMDEAKSLQSYLATRLFRFLVSLRKITQDATKSTYAWVPMQAWDRLWTDEALFKKYGITEDEAAHIEAMVKPMELADGN